MNDLFSQLDLPLQTNLSQEQHRFIVMISVIGSVTALYHGLVIPLFLWMGLASLAWFNVFSVIAWCLVVLLARQGMLYLPALLIVAEIGGYAALCTRYSAGNREPPFFLFSLGWAAFAIPINQWFRLFGIAVAILEFVLLYFTSGRSPGTALRASSSSSGFLTSPLFSPSASLTEETRRLLKVGYCFEERGMIPVKGKGEMRTYFLRRPVAEFTAVL